MAASCQISQGLGSPAGRQIAAVIWKTPHRINAPHIHPLRTGSERIERDAERNIESAGEDLHLLGLALRSHPTEHLDIAGAGLSEKDVAIGSNPHQARITQSRRIQLNLEPL